MTQRNHEIRRTLSFFYDDMDNEQYIDAIAFLDELYYYKVHTMSERSTVHDVLEKHKQGVVKRLLRYMKHYSAVEVAHFIPLTIKALRAFDINWPELDIIAVSANKTTVTENASPVEVANIVSGMRRAFNVGNDAAVAHRIIDMWRFSDDNRQLASTMLKSMSQHILSWTESSLKSDSHFIVQNGLNIFQVLPPYDWPELKPLLETYKTQIIRYLLQCMKDHDEDIVEYRVPKLHKWGVTWPELDILKRSADSELDIQRRRTRVLDEDDDNDTRDDFSTVYRNADPHRFLLTADEYVKYMDRLLQDESNIDQVTVELSTVGRGRRAAIKNWPELAAVINRHKAQLLRVIAYHFNRDHFGNYSAARSTECAGALKAIGVDWPEINQLIEKNKHKIIKSLLELVRDDYDATYIMNNVRDLKLYDAKWPELDVIAKSLSKGEINEADTEKGPVLASMPIELQYRITEWIRTLRDGMRRLKPRSIINFIQDMQGIKNAQLRNEIFDSVKTDILEFVDYSISLYEKPFADITQIDLLYNALKSAYHIQLRFQKCPELTQSIETYKPAIIKTILKQISSGSTPDAMQMVHYLKQLDIKWPELAIIQKSIGPYDAELYEDNPEDSYITPDTWPETAQRMFLAMLKHDFDDKSIGIALYHISQWTLDIYKIPGLEELLDQHKTQYLKIILNDMKNGAQYQYGCAEQYLGRLEGAKVKWPELKIIRNSLNTLAPHEGDDD